MRQPGAASFCSARPPAYAHGFSCLRNVKELAHTPLAAGNGKCLGLCQRAGLLNKLAVLLPSLSTRCFSDVGTGRAR